MVKITKMSGLKFNKIFKDKTFYKILKESLVHNNFTYKEGLNIDTNLFNPTGQCEKGGLYFCEKHYLHLYLVFGTMISKVIIPDDAQVYVEEKKFKADKIILEKIEYLKDLDLWNDHNFCKLAVQQDGCALEYVKECTEEICKLAVKQNGFALQYVEKQTEEICKLAVRQDGLALKYVNVQTEELCKLAVRQDCFALQFVKEQTEELCKLTVQQNAYALQFVKEQTEELCKLAVQQNCYTLIYVKDCTEEICKLAVQQNGDVLLYVKECYVNY